MVSPGGFVMSGMTHGATNLSNDFGGFASLGGISVDAQRLVL